MGKKSRDKGARGEREAAHAVAKHWNAGKCVRAAQINGSYSADLLNVAPGVYAEVKRWAGISACSWMKKAERSLAGYGPIPVVLMRMDGYPEWVVGVKISDLVALGLRIERQLTERQRNEAHARSKATGPSKGESGDCEVILPVIDGPDICFEDMVPPPFSSLRAVNPPPKSPNQDGSTG